MCGVYCVVTFIVLFVATVVCCPADAKYDYCIAYVSDLFGKWSISSSLAFSEMWQMMLMAAMYALILLCAVVDKLLSFTVAVINTFTTL